MNPIRRWRERADARWFEQWQREHRWDELAAYNTRISQGIVHTDEYIARMREEQAEFDGQWDPRRKSFA